MIRLLQGTVQPCDELSLILVTNGVGYQVYAPTDVLIEQDEELTLHIYSHIREDRFELYGFRTSKELAFFEKLLSINGVGPKMALAILCEPTQLIQAAIDEGDVKGLQKVKGVGKKLAERIILELKGKLDWDQVGPSKASVKPQHEEAIQALESLGYKRTHVSKVLDGMEVEIKTTEQLVRWFLTQ